MMNRLKNYLGIFICMVLAVAFCIYFDPHRKITLTLGCYSGSAWDVPYNDSYQAIDQIIRKFEKQYPYIKIKYEAGILKDDYSDWLSEKIINGKTPDIFMVPDADFSVLANTHVLKKLNGMMDENFLNTDRFYRAAVAAGSVDGTQYALPVEANPMMMCVNLDLLHQVHLSAPQNDWKFKDLYRYCRIITNKKHYGICNYTWQEAVESFGLDLFSADGDNAYFATAKVQSALEQYVQLRKLVNDYNVSKEDFDEGKVAFMPMTLAEYRTYKTYPYRVSRYFGFHWSILPMPGAAYKKIHMHTAMMAISSSTRHQQAAMNLLMTITAHEQAQKDILRLSAGASVLRSVMQYKNLSDYIPAAKSRLIDQILDDSQPYPNFKGYNQAINRADYLVIRSIANDTLTDDFSSIQREMQSIL